MMVVVRSRVFSSMLVVACCTIVARTANAGAGSPAPQGSDATVWSGVFTAAQAERGSAVYASECANCHASNLSGNESVPPLVGDEFVAAYDAKPVQELFEVIAKTMPQDSPGRLSRA